MKISFTLLFFTALLSSAFAQYGAKNGGGWDKGKYMYASNENLNHGHDNYGSYYFTPRERDMQIAQINREYDYKIRSVKNQYFVGWFQKKRQISIFENRRNNEISTVYAKFSERRNQFGDDRKNKGR